jgi:thiol:disulfide interchange protein DsbG
MRRAQSILSAAVILVLMTSAAMAADPPKPAAATTPLIISGPPQPVRSPTDPDPSTNHVLSEFMKTGVKVYFIGTQFGLNGWFLMKENQVQIAYTTLDNQNIIIGVLFNAQGDDVSSQQVKTLYDTNKEVNAYLTTMNAQQSGAANGGFLTPQPGIVPTAGTGSILPPASPGERLIQTLDTASAVTFGSPLAPKIYIVADPNCPHCQAAWHSLRNAVFGGRLQVRLIPVDAVSPDSQRPAALLLRSLDPLNAWDKYEAGDKTQLAGNPDTAALDNIRNNRAILDAWHIQVTPYMVYRARDGQVKIVQGEPEQANALVDDVAP